MRWIGWVAALALLSSCNLRYALLGFPQPVVQVAGTAPIELEYREAKGGLVILRGRVNGKAEVDFILDTGAPVTVLIDGTHTAALGLDTSRARPLGDPDNPGARLHEPAAWAAPRGAAAVPIDFRAGHPFVETRITLPDGRAIDSRMNVDTA